MFPIIRSLPFSNRMSFYSDEEHFGVENLVSVVQDLLIVKTDDDDDDQ